LVASQKTACRDRRLHLDVTWRSAGFWHAELLAWVANYNARFLPSAHDAVQINQLASAKQIECLQKIPRYPPFMEGLPVRSPTELLASQLQLAGSIQHLIAELALSATRYNTAVLRLAAFVHLLAVSQAHHSILFQLIPMSHSTALNFSNLTHGILFFNKDLLFHSASSVGQPKPMSSKNVVAQQIPAQFQYITTS